MCGVCGWYNRQGKVNGQVLQKMNQIAKYRGPDDEGYFVVDAQQAKSYMGDDSINMHMDHISGYNCETAYLGLGHRRLSIIDLSEKGHQPMVLEDVNLSITFNGEIYNYIEVRELLEQAGYCFETQSDTEVLLNAYREWGERCVEFFDGMWAFAIWDGNSNKLFFSRDRLGAKPFYYYLDDDNFIFASEIKQVIENPIVPRRLNKNIMVTSIMLQLSDYSEDTFIQDVKELRGGYSISLNMDDTDSVRNRLRIYKYWDVEISDEKDMKYYGEAMKAHDNAVKIRTRSDVPIGVLLSGGLDSSVLVAEISKNKKEHGNFKEAVKTFTTCFEKYDEGDEKRYASMVNDFWKTDYKYIYPDVEDSFDVFKEMIWHNEMPTELNSVGAYLTLREISKTGAKVMINGQGSDETMFGYERYYIWFLKEKLKKGKIKFLKEVIDIVLNSGLSFKRLVSYYIYFGNSKIRKLRCKVRMRKYVSSGVIKRYLNNRVIDKFLHFESLASMQYNELRGTQLTHILHYDDRFYMAHSMESRVPYIDYKYIEYATKIPEEMKIQNGYTKYLLRKYIEGSLPEEVVWRKDKMGWPSPRKRWIDKLNPDKVEQLFDNPKSGKLFNVRKIKELWKKNPYAVAFERFISVELFMRLFDIEDV